MDSPDFLGDEIRTATLEKIQLKATQHIPGVVIEDLDVRRLDDYLAGAFAFSLRAYVLGERLPQKTIEHPADWWQALKARWFPPWALKRWPVRMTVHHIDAQVLYPNLRLALPKESRVFKIATWADERPIGRVGRHDDTD